jgi:O-antigen/teichoic acid export membrane protein
MGADFAEHSYVLLRILAMGFFFLSLNVAPYFALLGLGKVRFVSIVNVAGGVVSLVATAMLTPIFGLAGAAAARLLYGTATTGSYCIKMRQIV